MASNIDERQLLVWFASCITALTSSAASGGGTTSINAMDNTSIANQVAADTGLTVQEKAIINSISTGMIATLVSCQVHKVL